MGPWPLLATVMLMKEAQDYMTENDPWRSGKCLIPDYPFCLPDVPTDGKMRDLWMATGAAYGSRRQHCSGLFA
ncbi:Eosinophil peroxidase [Dissostichus eleginoides]|uniref:Eosinophil peroxidase n=1 Tax=Dissostichus eleginoides TaxID=100907 RepID=A0AAD9FBN7_DISEL|nr:Eosinophil peroxidase [Dissostichus eleginoides]